MKYIDKLDEFANINEAKKKEYDANDHMAQYYYLLNVDRNSGDISLDYVDGFESRTPIFTQDSNSDFGEWQSIEDDPHGIMYDEIEKFIAEKIGEFEEELREFIKERTRNL